MTKRISKKPKVARQYELSQKEIIDTIVNRGGAPDASDIILGPDIRPNINRGNIYSKNEVSFNYICRK